MSNCQIKQVFCPYGSYIRTCMIKCEVLTWCACKDTHVILAVYRYQNFPFSDIRYSLFKKEPIPIADLIYVHNKLFFPCIAHKIHSQQQQNSNKTCKVINTVKNGDN